jgi:hypothetical protein
MLKQIWPVILPISDFGPAGGLELAVLSHRSSLVAQRLPIPLRIVCGP